MPLLMRWLHTGGAVAALGGLLFLVAALLPALRRADPEQAFLVMGDVLRRARAIVWVSLGALLVSGVYAAGAAGLAPGFPFHAVFGAKVLLSVLFVVTAAAGVLPAARPEALRRRGDWMRLALLLGSAVVLLSGYLRQLRLSG